MNHEDLITRFKNGKTRGSASHMYIENDTLYSYGRHFPLLIRHSWGFLQNGDKYSISTSKHQRHASAIATAIIPFSALNRANIDPYKLELIDKSDARYDKRTYKNTKGEMVTVNERRPEAALFKANGKLFLSSMDNWNYFISELPIKKIRKVSQAFDSLKPAITKNMAEDKDYIRQGEWFFIPSPDITDNIVKDRKKGRKKVWKLSYPQYLRNYNSWDRLIIYPKELDDLLTVENRVVNFLVNHNKHQEPHHYATEYGIYKGHIVVRGLVRHTGGRREHRQLKLGKVWHIAKESRHVISYGASGKTD